jgi:hypothetical protein
MQPQLKAAIDSLWRAQKSAAGVTVTYTQSGQSKNLTAVPGRTLTEADFGEGVIRTDRMHDFIVNIDEFGLVPQRGDTISWDGRKYEVLNPTGGKHFDEIGPYKQLYRIHAKEVYVG